MIKLAHDLERLRSLALGFMVVGQIAVVAALIGLVQDSAEPSEPASELGASSTTEPAAASSTSSTTAAPTTVVQSTTSTSTVDTTSTAAPTTTLAPTTTAEQRLETLDEFVSAFNASNSTGDTSFAAARLHPVVIDIFTLERCESWLEARFSSTTIEVVGEATQPTATLLDVSGGQVEVLDYFTVSALLTFQGSVSETTASFAYVDGKVHWFTNCEAT